MCREARANVYKTEVGYQKNTPLPGLKYKWKDNIKMHLKEDGCVGVDSNHLARERVQ
jgi:hypothetical protein